MTTPQIRLVDPHDRNIRGARHLGDEFADRRAGAENRVRTYLRGEAHVLHEARRDRPELPPVLGELRQDGIVNEVNDRHAR